MAWYKNLAYLNEATIYSCNGSILVRPNGECDLHPQEHLIVDKLLHLDDVQSFEYGILDLIENRSWIPWKSLFLHFFFKWLAV